jgi:hypothetical protein|tara:strand:+ start:3787 stop:5040 length:1254 start_codon:yes stop_codon:yes gene_type:complete
MNNRKPYSQSDIDEMLKQEEAAIQAAIADGRLDPRLDKDIWKSFEFQYQGNHYRTFILEYGLKTFGGLKPKNVRARVTDEIRLADMVELLKQAGQINMPLVSTYHSAALEEISHGHHRYFGSRDAFPLDTLIPRFLQSRKFYEVITDATTGEKVYYDAQNPQYKQQVARMKPNPMPKAKKYERLDVVQQLTQCYTIDPGLDGLADPNAAELSREDFDKWMIEFYPEHFVAVNARGYIFNRFKELVTTGGKMVKPYKVEAEIRQRMSRLGWDTDGLSIKKDSIGRWYDSVNDCLLAKTETNGDRLEAQIIFPLIKKYYGGDLDSWVEQGVTKVRLYFEPDSRVKDFKSDLKSLSALRLKETKRVKAGNKLLGNCGVPFEIEMVYYPDQLDGDPKDEGLLVDFTPKPRQPKLTAETMLH